MARGYHLKPFYKPVTYGYYKPSLAHLAPYRLISNYLTLPLAYIPVVVFEIGCDTLTVYVVGHLVLHIEGQGNYIIKACCE